MNGHRDNTGKENLLLKPASVDVKVGSQPNIVMVLGPTPLFWFRPGEVVGATAQIKT